MGNQGFRLESAKNVKILVVTITGMGDIPNQSLDNPVLYVFWGGPNTSSRLVFGSLGIGMSLANISLPRNLQRSDLLFTDPDKNQSI